ncbi:MAG: glycosyltransferase family 2 protein [Ruminococcaceae bacterium]|nr:glycosyltransferase family 2 protein [Oscillospiraceae bacterium]
MSNVQVLVACMNQKDDSLYREMNIQTDAVLANQCDEYSYRVYTEPDGSKVELISTADRGVGKNRNKALMNASGKYLLCSDQDMIYVDGYEKIIEEAFAKCPKADIIVFNLKYLNRLTSGRRETGKFKKLHLWKCMRYGTARVAMRKSAIDKACLSFSTLYGGGAKYSSGEDSLFIREAFRKGLKMYVSPIIIAKVKQEESSWFHGYNDKYFIDKGILIANAFPVMKHLLIYYFAYGMRNDTKEYSFFKICKLMRQGIKDFKAL